MAFAGLRGTGSWGTDERPKSFREGILWRQPEGSAPLFALMAKARKDSLTDPEHSWWEEVLTNVRISINDASGYTATSTTLTIDSGGLELVIGDVLLLEKTEGTTYDNEILIVSSITSDTVIVAKRGIAGSTAVGIADNTFLTRIGSAHEEGATLPTISQRNPTKYTNYAQIFRTVYGVTKTADATTARTGNGYKNDRKRKGFDHSNKMEWAMLYGQSSEDTSGDHAKRYLGGLREFITSNVTIFTTSPNEDTFLDAATNVFDYNSESGAGNQRIVLAGNGFLNNLNKVARNSSSSRINFDGTINVYGMELQKWVLPQGTFGVRSHPLMSVHPRFTNSAFILDFSNLVYRPLRDTKFEDDVQAPGEDARKGHWLTEMSIEIQHEITAAYIGNFVV